MNPETSERRMVAVELLGIALIMGLIVGFVQILFFLVGLLSDL